MYSFEKIDAYISNKIKENFIPGVVLVISKENHILFEKAYGDAQQFQFELDDHTENNYLKVMQNGKRQLAIPIPLTTKHLFDLASLTKVLATNFAIMLLLDKQKLQLDSLVKDYFPEFNTREKSTISIRHLLSHTAGFLPWKPFYYHVSNNQDAIKFIGDLPLAYPVGSQRKYSDLDFMILGQLIEQVANQRLDEFLHDHLYQKLNLPDTLFNPLGKKYQIVSTSHGNPFEYKMIADPHFGYPCEEKIEDFNQWRHYTLTGEVNDGNAYHVFSGISGHA